MAASINDKITDVFNSANPNVARVTGTRAALGATLTCDNLAGWPTGTAVHFSTYQINTSNAVVAGTQIDWKGIVSGNNIGSLTRQAGATDSGNSIGDVVEMNPTGSWWHDLWTGLTNQHSQLDGSHTAVTAISLVASAGVTGATVTSTGDLQLRSTSLETIASERMFDHVASGLVWSGDSYASTRNASMTSGVVYINGQRLAISSVTARAFTASKDTYIDILNTAGVGSVVYTEVTNNAASPALAANSLRIGIIVTGATNIAAATSVNQGQTTIVLPIASSIAYTKTDSLGNLICPRDPNRRVLGYKQIIANQGSITTQADVTGLSCPVIIPTGRDIKITAYAGMFNGTVDAYNNLYIYDGATQLEAATANSRSGSATETLKPEIVVTPSATSKTYKVQAAGSGGTATLSAASTSPAFILVELV